MNLCKEKEKRFWSELSEKFMSEEETDIESITATTATLIKSKPQWRSTGCVQYTIIFTCFLVLERFISKLDERDKKKNRRQPRLKRIDSGIFVNCPIPENAPSWAIRSPSVSTSPASAEVVSNVANS